MSEKPSIGDHDASAIGEKAGANAHDTNRPGSSSFTDETGDWLRRIAGIEVFQWNPLRETGDAERFALVNNFGDLLGPVVVERMLARHLPGAVPNPGADGRRLLTIGSVMHLAGPRSVIWGTGINGKVRNNTVQPSVKLDIRAVRGPWTAQFLHDRGIRVPRVFGDPALLLPRLLPELAIWRKVKRFDVLLAPNFHDYGDFTDELPRVDPTAPVSHVLRMIAQSRFVIGSSLHAIAVADALGVPARFIASRSESEFKYRDYLAGTGRDLARIARSVPEALDMGGHEPPRIDLDLLEAAFPWDLWHDPIGRTVEVPMQVTDLFQVDPVVLENWKSSIADAGAENRARLRGKFFDDIVPRTVAAVKGADAGNQAAALECAAEYRARVLPWLHSADLNEDERELAVCIERRDAVRLAICDTLHGRPVVAAVRSVRWLGEGVLLSLAVTLASTVNDLEALHLVLESSHADRRVTIPSLFFSLQNRQWLLETDVFVPRAELADDTHWRVSVDLVSADGSTRNVAVQSSGTSHTPFCDALRNESHALSGEPCVLDLGFAADSNAKCHA